MYSIIRLNTFIFDGPPSLNCKSFASILDTLFPLELILFELDCPLERLLLRPWNPLPGFPIVPSFSKCWITISTIDGTQPDRSTLRLPCGYALNPCVHLKQLLGHNSIPNSYYSHYCLIGFTVFNLLKEVSFSLGSPSFLMSYVFFGLTLFQC